MPTYFALWILLLSSFAVTSCVHAPEFRNDKKTAKAQPKYNTPASALKTKEIEKEPLMVQEMKVGGLDITKKEAQEVESLPKPVIDTHDLLIVPPESEGKVQMWVDYFQGRGRKHMVRYLERFGRYEEYMTDILTENGLPRELIYVALIESGFSSSAHSHASAVGYWQFIRGTGRGYGLKINSLVDERRDPRKATEAASQYFKALYNVFGSWPLALASYNAGENRVMRAIMRNYSRDFWELARTRQLPRETSNYVPKFIAAARIGKNPAKFGFGNIQAHDDLAYDEVELTKAVSMSTMAKNLGVSRKTLKKLNPMFKTDFVPIYRGNSISFRVPEGMLSKAKLAAAKSASKRPYNNYASRDYHKVRRGDSLYRIARRYGTSVTKLQRLNGLSRRSIIRPGMKIRLPGGSGSTASTKASYHRVRRGDNLTDIARRYGVSISSLKKINGINGSVIHPGTKLKLKPGRTYAKASGGSKYHRIRRGETLYGIAKRYGVGLSELARANNMTVRTRVRAGVKIVIP